MSYLKHVLCQIVLFSCIIVVSHSVTVYGEHGNAFASALKLRQAEKEQKQDLSKVPGTPWVDYPLYHSIPHTKFSCHDVPAIPGIYANVETGCQAYHVCHDGREGSQGASFLCTNGTIFNQAEFTCDWWYNVNCHDAPTLYRLNLEPEKNPYFPKAKLEEEKLQRAAYPHY